MAKDLKVDIVKRETILPSSPTPQHLKRFKLSLLDQLSPAVYTPLILFYTTKNSHGNIEHQYVQKLKTSLSEALVLFYPLAGRIKDEVTVDCKDEGAEFLEAQANFKISEIFDHPDAANLQQFLPKEIISTEAATGCLLSVQATIFECGGLTIGVSMSHKLSDASTLSTFMKCWAGKALCSSHVVVPELSAASIFPPMDILVPLPKVSIKPQQKCITKRFVFSASKIVGLKAKSTSSSVRDPTRVEAVTALILKCALKASTLNSKSLKPSVVAQVVNLRRRAIPPISENCIGNLVASFLAKTTEKRLDLQDLVIQLRIGKDDFGEKYGKRLRGEEASSTICEIFMEARSVVNREDIDFYIFSSWCNFGLYEVDFGWGKPTWMSLTSSSYKNCVMLMDTSDGKGIEAWVILSEEDMAVFDRDEELREFSS